MVLLALQLALAADANAPLVCEEYGTNATSVDVPGVPVAESSGLAAGRVNEGVYYTLADAGNPAALYLFRVSDGIFLRAQTLEGAVNTDWEDLAAGPCPSALLEGQPDAEGCLYVADIGDNDGVRDHVTVWVVPETDDDSAIALGCDLAYDDGQSHDAEALAVSPDGVVRIFTKEGSGPTKVFKANDLSCFGEVQVIAKETEVDLGDKVTGAAMRADGEAMVLRAKDHGWLWTGCSWSFDDAPVDVDLPGEPFGEAITFTPEGLLASTQEEDHVTVHVWPCDTQVELKCGACGCAAATPTGVGALVLAGLAAAGVRRATPSRRARGRGTGTR